MPKSVVIDPSFEWDDDEAGPGRLWTSSVIYELHVKGFTKASGGSARGPAGTYGGLASPTRSRT